MNGKMKVNRKEFLKYLLGAFFSFLCIVKLPSINFAKSNCEDLADGNGIAY